MDTQETNDMQETNDNQQEQVTHQFFTLSSYEPVELTISRPSTDDVWEKAAQQANHLIDSQGGSHESGAEWFSENFGVQSAQDLFNKCVEYQKQLVELQVNDMVEAQAAGQLAARLVEEIPSSMVDPIVEAMKAAGDSENASLFDKEGSQEAVNMTEDELYRMRAHEAVARGCALEAYALHKNIKVSLEDFEEFQKTRSYQQAIAMGFGKPAIIQMIVHKKALADLLSQSRVNFV